MKKGIFAVIAFIILSTVSSFAQLTILNVPSADVMDKGKAYVRFDQTYMNSASIYTATPNFMLGLGRGFEADLNVESISNVDGYQLSIVPGVKYSYKFTKNFTGFAGDKVGIPVHNKYFNGTNYAYAAGAYSFSNVRFTAGAYNSQNYVAFGNKTGALLGLEVTALKAKDGHGVLIPAYDWSSGKGSNGVSTFGLMIYPTPKLMIIPSYQVGNYGATYGNHQAVLYLGYQLN